MEYFLLEKQVFNGLLKVIGIQKFYFDIKDLTSYITLIKGVTMRAIFSNPAGWKFKDSYGW